MKKLLLVLLCFGFFSASAANPVYEVKKESIDVYVSQDVSVSIEMIASVDLISLKVKDFSEGSYSVNVIFVNKNVAGIKTEINEVEHLYVFKLSEQAKKILKEKQKNPDIKLNRFDKLFKEADNAFNSSFKEPKKISFINRTKNDSGTRKKATEWLNYI